MLLQVHDELVFETPRTELPVLAELVKRNMESVVTLSVPLKADLSEQKIDILCLEGYTI